MRTTTVGVKRATRAETAAATRRRILESARKLFLRDGFGATSLDRIAQEAGLTKGAIYGHFRNKAQLFVAMDEGGLGIGPMLSSHPPADLDWDGLIRRLAQDMAAAKINRRELAAYLEILAFSLRDRSMQRRAAAAMERIAKADSDTFAAYPGAPLGFPHDRFVMAGVAGVIGLVIYRELAPELMPDEAFEDLLLGLSRRLQEGSQLLG